MIMLSKYHPNIILFLMDEFIQFIRWCIARDMIWEDTTKCFAKRLGCTFSGATVLFRIRGESRWVSSSLTLDWIHYIYQVEESASSTRPWLPTCGLPTTHGIYYQYLSLFHLHLYIGIYIFHQKTTDCFANSNFINA